MQNHSDPIVYYKVHSTVEALRLKFLSALKESSLDRQPSKGCVVALS